jgi:SAM-dependent methyltransferase
MGSHNKITSGSFTGSSGRITSGRGLAASLARYFARWHFFHAIHRNVPPGALLLDFGCGGGDAFLASRFRAIGLDLDAESARSARGVYSSAMNADVGRLPIKEGSLDAAVSSFVLEHLPASLAPAALWEIHGSLRPGGALVCLCDLDCDHPMLWLVRRLFPEGYRQAYVEVPGHVGLRREGAWAQLLTEQGFEIVCWRLLSRFPVLDLTPLVQSGWSTQFPAGIRWLGDLAARLGRLRGVAEIWNLTAVVLDDLTRLVLPRRWAYRLLFVARKQTDQRAKGSVRHATNPA